jgi:hypothetical protein
MMIVMILAGLDEIGKWETVCAVKSANATGKWWVRLEDLYRLIGCAYTLFLPLRFIPAYIIESPIKTLEGNDEP